MTTERLHPASRFGENLSRNDSMPPSARLILKLLANMVNGSLTVTFPDGTALRFGEGLPHAEIVLNNWNVCDAALKNGDIGFGETYIAGDWSTPDIAALLDVMVANRNAIEAVVYGKWWGKVLYRVKHFFNRNTRAGSRKNIHAHYDIGNAFYGLWLDRTMTYSSGIFGPAAGAVPNEEELVAAQERKYRRILDQLGASAGSEVLEIGCGWGGFAELAARDGLRVTGLTLSSEQLELARERLMSAEVATRPELRLQDYRDLNGKFDAIASIEMFEAVGENYWTGYFECLKKSLKHGGRAVIQTITIDERLFPTYRKSSDFIQQFIFPGGMLPTMAVFRAQAERVGLRVTDQFAFGQDYARTLCGWLSNFHAREREVREQGFDDRFIRTWEFYLAYCRAAFKHANTDVVQFTLEHA